MKIPQILTLIPIQPSTTYEGNSRYGVGLEQFGGRL